MIWTILGTIVVLVLIVGVGVYNGLGKSRMQTVEAWSQIDALKRRNDLIPNLIENR